MVFKGFEVIIKPKRKDEANNGFIYTACDQSHLWAIKEIGTNKIILKSDFFETKEKAEEDAKYFVERLFLDSTDA